MNQVLDTTTQEQVLAEAQARMQQAALPNEANIQTILKGCRDNGVKYSGQAQQQLMVKCRYVSLLSQLSTRVFTLEEWQACIDKLSLTSLAKIVRMACDTDGKDPAHDLNYALLKTPGGADWSAIFPPQPLKANDAPELAAFLASMNLTSILKKFLDADVTTIELLQGLNDDDLTQLGLTVGQKVKIRAYREGAPEAVRVRPYDKFDVLSWRPLIGDAQQLFILESRLMQELLGHQPGAEKKVHWQNLTSWLRNAARDDEWFASAEFVADGNRLVAEIRLQDAPYHKREAIRAEVFASTRPKVPGVAVDMKVTAFSEPGGERDRRGGGPFRFRGGRGRGTRGGYATRGGAPPMADVCYWCGGPGHRSPQCSVRLSGASPVQGAVYDQQQKLLGAGGTPLTVVNHSKPGGGRGAGSH